MKLRRYASNVVVVPALAVARDARLAPADRRLDLATGFTDHRGTPHEVRCSDTAFERLVAAFQAAEADASRSCPPELAVHGVWAEWLDLNYGGLRKLLRASDTAGLRRLLENVHREPMSTGVGGTFDDLRAAPRPLVQAYYRTLWANYRDLLAEVRPDWADVASPVVGNPQGAWVDGRLVQVDTLEKAYYATVLSGEMDGPTPSRIVEIGAGMGGQALQFLRLSGDAVGHYTIVDLPEVACLSAYCLMAALGEDRVRLFGESRGNGGAIVDVLPHWCVTGFADRSADLVFNSYSFSEMDSATSSFYLSQVEKFCAGVFFHVNHETRFRYRRPDGGTSVNRLGSELVPDPARFRLVRRRTRQFVRPENRANVAFEYLYRRLPDDA